MRTRFILIAVVMSGLLLAAAGLAWSSMQPYGVRNMAGLALGTVSFCVMALCMVLAMRLRVIEWLIGGLDRVYAVHKWLGVFAIATMVLHENFHPKFKAFLTRTELGHFAKEVGEFMYYPLLVLVAVSFFKRLPWVPFEIPYALWRFSHRFLGLIFAAICVHVLVIDTPLVVGHPLKTLWVACALVGLGAFAYVELLLPRLRRHAYQVVKIIPHPQVSELLLSPIGKPMRWRAGQFAFLACERMGLRESHPFTLASSPQESGQVRLMIKALGDWTCTLGTALHEGDAVTLSGPYGRFDFRGGAKTQLWVAGGIGITPFLAWAHSLDARAHDIRIHLIHIVRTEEEALHREHFARVAAEFPHFTYTLYVSGRQGHFGGEACRTHTPFPMTDAALYFCGPAALRQHLLRELAALGSSPRSVHYELFEFR